jgi:nucleoside-diphosphate-sugar epimerase
MTEKILVTGAGGFIGHHLVKTLKEQGKWVRGADIKHPEYEDSAADEFEILDLRRADEAMQACRNVDRVYHLAANMGGIGFIETFKGLIVRDSTMINIHTIEAARVMGVKRFLFTSSACIYPGYKQKDADVTPLKEEDAYPADPEDGYGWEKLYMERVCRHYREDFGLDTRIVRFHNIFGPLGTYEGGREKAPAAMCRKIAEIEDGGEIEVWGDGEQTRSFCYVSDCVAGLMRLMESDFKQPINLGQDRMISINELAEMVANAAGKKITLRHELDRPLGVRGRNSDNTLLREILKWEPQVSLEDGMKITYDWIHGELAKQGRVPVPA